ncbi:CAP-Gly domain-containing protein [Annulohypoxylon maeteangense]|uniref:CAP-Gly domain-containing protein n=1 Tax=Annulohypoxylon maeteangense TaxID=1927788 RepID=UPI002007AC48|nr:CAP-Gly domain-containing protein [Annulohypoxylon maeteangense]KAI0884871.1 CAP-Gly domain-containing protein [Annulohypoxylon maeteangense]
MSDIAVGQSIRLSDGRNATVRYVGQTHFAAGDWVGVELEDDSGKNDGAVQGERYFDCPQGRGMFVRPITVTVLQAAPPPPKSTAPIRRGSRTSTAPGRSSSVTDPTMPKRMSLNAPSPSPVSRTRPSSIGRSPTKSPTKQLGTGPSSLTNSRTGTPSNARISSIAPKTRASISGGRSSMGPPPLPSTGPRRQASTSSTSGRVVSGATRPAGGRVSSITGRGAARPTSGRVRSGDSLSGGEGGNRSGLGSPLKSDGEQTSPVQSRTRALERLTSAGRSATSSKSAMGSAAPSRTPGSAGPSGRPVASNAVTRENEDLKAKLKVLERKRSEDREKMKEMERLQEQRDKFETINKKIEGKYQTTAQENVALRKQLKEAEERLEQIETLQAEHDSVMELATLDREMAEETAEVYKAELEALKQKVEELELEVEILREENTEYSQGMSPEERASAGWLQMERHNERLREALIRLRDLTQQQEEESRAQIKALEKDLADFEAIKEQYQIAKEKLLESETRAEDLRQQLDDNLGAETMIEQLSYEKLQQYEHINELKAVIDDLEALKEINDELEINHVQNEKEMQEELDLKDSVIAEQARRTAERDDTISDLEYTLSRFRELVTNLQTDLEDIRASHAVNEAESEQLNSKSRAMMDLNQKLQISAAKTQVKTIDLELQRMDAQEAQQHLQIIKLFLPESYNTDKDSVLALLRFRRLAFKANLLHGFVKERINGQAHPGHEDDVFAGCDALDKLSWVSSMCDRFVNAISHCSLEEFAKYEGALYELEPVERALNAWIDGLRRDELKEKQCASELQRTIALMTHLGEVHISEGLESFADEMQMKTILMQSHLESAATAFNVVKDMVQRVIPPNNDEDELAQHFAKKSEAVISQTRSAKVIISKAVRSLEDLRARSLALTPDTAEAFEQCETSSQELAEMSRKIGIDLHALLSEEGRPEPFTYPEVQSTVHRTIMTTFSSAESDLFSTYLSKLRVLTGQITDLAAVCADLSQTQEFERSIAPWLLRAQELKALKTIPIDAEEELRQVKEHYNEARRTIALRDENLSTATLRIETLEARMRDANTKASRIADLEAQIVAAQELVASLKKDIEQQDREAKTLEADRDKWKKIAGDSRAFGDEAGDNAAGAKAGQERAVATAREMDTLKAEIASLQEAVRYLREDNRRARTTEQARHDWLAEPLVKPRPAAEQRKQLVAAESRDALSELLKMATSAHVFDLGSLPKDKQAWRPAKSTPQYHSAKLHEDYEAWKSWEASIVQKSKVVLGAEPGRKRQQDSEQARSMRRAAAKLQIRLPDVDGKMIPGGNGKGVQVLGSREWQNLQGKLSPAI